MLRLAIVRSLAARAAPRLARGLAVTPDAVFRKGSAPVPQKGKAKAPEARDLGSVLERELAYEREDSAGTLESLKAIAADITDFKLVDTVGHARFHLTRTLGSQEIRIDVDCTPVQTDEMPEEEEEGAEAAEGEEGEEDHNHMEGNRVLINIKDTAKGKTLQVGGTVTDMLQVHRVTLYDSGSEPSPDAVFGGADDIPLYVGPAFEELDDAVQNGFYEYLEERGVHDELAAKLSDYANTKEQTEYVRWLQSIRTFVA